MVGAAHGSCSQIARMIFHSASVSSMVGFAMVRTASSKLYICRGVKSHLYICRAGRPSGPEHRDKMGSSSPWWGAATALTMSLREQVQG